jgi:DNA-binding NarL/FixJ family response regulator
MKTRRRKTPHSGRGSPARDPASKGMPPTTASLRLLIVDDHAVVRGGLEAMLAVAPGIERIATAGDGAEALKLCESFAPDVILLDLRMPGLDGHSTLEVLAREWPQVRVIMLTGNDTPAEVKLARRNGAAGFLSKSADPGTLLGVIEKVAAGGTHFPHTRAGSHPEDTGLSARELEVLQHLARGLTNEDIGLALGVSGQTIKGHLKLIFPKLAVATRAEAVTRAHELGLV